MQLGCALLKSCAWGQVSLMDESGNTKDDLTLPKGTDDAEKLAVQLQEDFDSGKEIVVTVLKVNFWRWPFTVHYQCPVRRLR